MFTSRLVNDRAQFGKQKGAVVGSDRGTLRSTSATSARLKNVAKLPGGTLTVDGRLEAAGKGAVSILVVAGRESSPVPTAPSRSLRPTNPKTAVNIYRLSYGPIA